MDVSQVEEAVELLEKANTDLEPELLSAPAARRLMAAYARAGKLAAFGVAALSRKLDDAVELATITGTSVGKARAAVATGKVLGTSGELSAALKHGDVSLDQATEIASAEQSAPGVAADLAEVARRQPFHVLREKARKVRLEAEQHRDLAARQRAARCARSHGDELGMIHISLALEPHVGAPIVARAEAEASRLAKAKTYGEDEPFEAHLADAYAALLAGAGKGRARRPELVVLVSHEVAMRGWTDVRAGELCKIPGLGPVSPQVAKEIAADAFLSGVFHDGKDLRNLVRWTKNIPIEVLIALELGDPPSFDGIMCVDCGNRFRTEFDHMKPRAAHGPTSNSNLKPRCWRFHQAKTVRDRRAGRLKPAEP